MPTVNEMLAALTKLHELKRLAAGEMRKDVEPDLRARHTVYCVLCERVAVTTAAHIPVCNEHYQEYIAEARQYPDARPVLERLERAHAKRLAALTRPPARP